MAGDTEMSDEELVKQAIDGDERAFMALVRRYETAIFRLTIALLGHREDAEDATQDTFVLAFRRLQTLRDASSFPLWLRKLAIRVCLRYRRRRTAEREFIEPLSGERESEILFRADLDPESEVEKSELRELVRRIVSELPEPFQVVIVLYHMDGLSYEEIAKVLGISIGTVRSRLARARAMLRTKLASLLKQWENSPFSELTAEAKPRTGDV
jgi:RNA polymerase sigma-70 factor (ECF subfamily)